jgi:hypothetical protein
MEPIAFKGESFIGEKEVVTFQWVIKDFKEFLDFDQVIGCIKSPSFKMDQADRSFRLEMELQKNTPASQGRQCPVFLVNETGGEMLLKIALEDYGPKNLVEVSLEAGVVAHTSCFILTSEDWKKVMTVKLPASWNNFPNEVTIKIKLTLCQPAKRNVS